MSDIPKSVLAGVLAAAFVLVVGLIFAWTPPTQEMDLVHPNRKLPHVVYLRDTAGDCIAVYGTSLTRASEAIIQHVEKRWCQ